MPSTHPPPPQLAVLQNHVLREHRTGGHWLLHMEKPRAPVGAHNPPGFCRLDDGAGAEARWEALIDPVLGLGSWSLVGGWLWCKSIRTRSTFSQVRSLSLRAPGTPSPGPGVNLEQLVPRYPSPCSPSFHLRPSPCSIPCAPHPPIPCALHSLPCPNSRLPPVPHPLANSS